MLHGTKKNFYKVKKIQKKLQGKKIFFEKKYKVKKFSDLENFQKK